MTGICYVGLPQRRTDRRERFPNLDKQDAGCSLFHEFILLLKSHSMPISAQPGHHHFADRVWQSWLSCGRNKSRWMKNTRIGDI